MKIPAISLIPLLLLTQGCVETEVTVDISEEEESDTPTNEAKFPSEFSSTTEVLDKIKGQPPAKVEEIFGTPDFKQKSQDSDAIEGFFYFLTIKYGRGSYGAAEVLFNQQTGTANFIRYHQPDEAAELKASLEK